MSNMVVILAKRLVVALSNLQTRNLRIANLVKELLLVYKGSGYLASALAKKLAITCPIDCVSKTEPKLKTVYRELAKVALCCQDRQAGMLARFWLIS